MTACIPSWPLMPTPMWAAETRTWTGVGPGRRSCSTLCCSVLLPPSCFCSQHPGCAQARPFAALPPRGSSARAQKGQGSTEAEQASPGAAGQAVPRAAQSTEQLPAASLSLQCRAAAASGRGQLSYSSALPTAPLQSPLGKLTAGAGTASRPHQPCPRGHPQEGRAGAGG